MSLKNNIFESLFVGKHNRIKKSFIYEFFQYSELWGENKDLLKMDFRVLCNDLCSITLSLFLPSPLDQQVVPLRALLEHPFANLD